MKKNITDIYRYRKDFYSLLGLSLFWSGLFIASKPKFLAIFAGIIIAVILSVLNAPSLIKDYKRRGFIIPRFPWEGDYMDEVQAENEKKLPRRRIFLGIIAILFVSLLIIIPYFSENLFNESIKVLVFILALLLLETATVCFYYKKEIYKIKKQKKRER
ncbi:TPA: hypothetical protein DDW69_00285 [candidate division CPR2 bacterium]|uniref:Uncharacterized protein n=1 Tax=candidate division CPR2 bacterium GW2011_GWC1_41_48 TaxID=1618344 RepID=A0A0G0W9H0_UNCC2|nr:MAG: hypothetical protein UT47_C0005G0013 [candidate division CPR2 bacterium GW2011_GWC2_39_35]KKR28180.1 MAG: hypothetical protein UT60_C0026G0011 [candidate division CPR2 bacterium GW2011_GWD2_39_7]KKS08702.1 MAG: hypothetical protein UU65_C0005G0013 [candidate division CPR2 bacterium GW2011_GWC1_41_48]OGB72290.1 MAG: hypothetical protein A2Y26_03500 [candidate division CPR2 bacterium GWD2_39_7]HBG81261.1 hypothetical protein [candidate division CPR2 bacterium]